MGPNQIVTSGHWTRQGLGAIAQPLVSRALHWSDQVQWFPAHSRLAHCEPAHWDPAHWLPAH
jgi:hypothetical protein